MVRRFSCALILLCAAFQARGGVITFDTLLGAMGNNTYNGFVGATVDDVFYKIICDDYYHDTDVPSGPWQYNVSTLPTVAFARFGNDPAAVTRYQQAALLLAGDGSTVAGLQNVTSADDITAYQYALWRLFGANADDINGASTLEAATLADLTNGTDYGSIFAALRVYTPGESAMDNQEFLGLDNDWPASDAPEPGSGLLLATGLVAALFVKRWLINAARSSGAARRRAGS